MYIEQVSKNETMKITTSCEIYKTKCFDGSNLLLFGKRKCQSFEILRKQILHF